MTLQVAGCTLHVKNKKIVERYPDHYCRGNVVTFDV